MGVLNVTPDSFSDGGRFLDHEAAIEHGHRLIDEGAAIVDVGGESTRPGADPVGPVEEARRVVPVVAGLAGDVRVSIDTRHAEVARVAVTAGATIVNDISASLGDVAADLGVGWVAMHMRGDPRTMQDEPVYADVVAEVRDFLVERAERAAEAGATEVWIDPGIGFGKSLAENLALMNALPLFHALGHPLLLGASRKRMIGALSKEAPVDQRLGGSVALALEGMRAGVQVVRVHDVAETVQSRNVWRGLRDAALTDFADLPA